jgi:hypothetical protein
MIQVVAPLRTEKIIVVEDFSLLLSLCECLWKCEKTWDVEHNFRKKIRAEESDRPLSYELVLEVALPPVRRVHLVQDRVLADSERIAARMRDSAAGLPLEGSHEH